MNLPEIGFYQHYKHDPNGAPNNYTYEVIGIGKDTEDGALTVLYRPLYENDWLAPAGYFVRPLDLFMGDVTIDGVTVPRFKKISDPRGQ